VEIAFVDKVNKAHFRCPEWAEMSNNYKPQRRVRLIKLLLPLEYAISALQDTPYRSSAAL